MSLELVLSRLSQSFFFFFFDLWRHLIPATFDIFNKMFFFPYFFLKDHNFYIQSVKRPFYTFYLPFC